METIANALATAAEGEVRSGRAGPQPTPPTGAAPELVTARQEAVKQVRSRPYRTVTITCAPNHRGDEAEIQIPHMWQSAAKKLVAAGDRRHFWSHARDDAGLNKLYEVWAEIREIWDGPAYAAGIPVTTAAKLVGVSRAALHNILNDKRGREPRATTLPDVKWPKAAHEAHRKATEQTD